MNKLGLLLAMTVATPVRVMRHSARAMPQRIRMQIDPPPPELDERQSQFMKARGFTWNAKTRSWIKGDVSRTQRLECRSGTRVLRWEGDQPAEPTLSCVRKATSRFEAALREAREAALNNREEDRKIELQLKDRIAKGQAPYIWLVVQVLCLASLFTTTASLSVDHPPPPAIDAPPFFLPVAIGVAFAPFLSTLRRERWRRQPGVEDGDGALERLLVDAQLGSYALPAPWEWRASEPTRWGAAACAAESLASVNMAFAWHGCVQQAVADTIAPFAGAAVGALAGVLVVAGAAVGRTSYFYDEARDGLPAEVDAATRLARTADSYYLGMTSTSADEAQASMAATRALAAAWTDKFAAVNEEDDEAKRSQFLLAFVHASTCALAFELSGRSVVAPAVALALTAADVYVLRPDTEQSRATLQLSALPSRTR